MENRDYTASGGSDIEKLDVYMKPADTRPYSIGVWGDSVMLGVVLDEIAGRHRILKENAVALCSQALKVTINNFSSFGCTVEKGKKRLLQFLENGKHCDAAVIEYGGNDCDMPWEAISQSPGTEHSPKVPLEEFAAQIQEMIDALIKNRIMPLLTTLPPLHPGRYLDWISRNGLSKDKILEYLGDVHYIYRHQERYSLEIVRLAVKNGCHLIDIRSAFLKHRNYHELLCSDGIHPNDKGQMMIREAFVKFVGAQWPDMGLLVT